MLLNFQTTSLPLKVLARAQINILVKPIPRIKMYRNVPSKLLPIIWLEQSFEVDNQMAFMIKLMLWTPFIGQMIGFIMTIICIYLIYRFSNKKRKERENLRENAKNEKDMKSVLHELFPLVNGKNTK